MVVQEQLFLAKSGSTVGLKTAWHRIILLIVLAYEGAGGIVGGLLLTIAPDGHLMEMPVDIMHGVFVDFLIPGLILLGLGVLNSFAFVSVLRKAVNDWFMAGLAMGGFYIWFVVEIIILKELHWLHLMWGLPVLIGLVMTIPLISSRNESKAMFKGLLVFGILSSLWYIAINIFVPFFYDGYSAITLTVSELSAIGAPTRILWVLVSTLYVLMFVAFGWGVLNLSYGNRTLNITGALIIVYGVFNMYWPPMHMRGSETTLTDTLHIVWASTTVLMMMVSMVLGALARSKIFRIYTIASLIILIFFGVLTFLEAPNIPTNGPTPAIGIWERINIGVFMIWVIVFSISLMRDKKLFSKVST